MDNLMTVMDVVNGRMSLDTLQRHAAAQMLQHAFDHVWEMRHELEHLVLQDAMTTLDDARMDVMP